MSQDYKFDTLSLHAATHLMTGMVRVLGPMLSDYLLSVQRYTACCGAV